MKFIKLLYSLIIVFLVGQLSAQTNGNQLIIKMLNVDTNVENCEPINSENTEFAPAYYQGGLVFVSSQTIETLEDKSEESTTFDLSYADIDLAGIPRKPARFSTEISKQLYDGSIAFSQDFSQMYFTAQNIKYGEALENEKGEARTQIMKAMKGRNDWMVLNKLPFSCGEYSCAHPSLSFDEQKLYFSSDMPGGYGGMDLYVVEKSGDSWSDPVNLGPEINTTGNEIYPFIHKTGVLFFSSDRQDGIGGYDIFMIDLVKPIHDVLINLGVPFNSDWDDLSIVVSDAGTGGYFTSTRKGGKGKADLYKFEALRGLFDEDSREALVTVIDQKTGQRLPDVDIRVFPGAADGFLENSLFYDLELVPTLGNPYELSLQMVRKQEEELGAPTTTTDAIGDATVQLKKGNQYIILASKKGYKNEDIIYSTVHHYGDPQIQIALEPQDCVVFSGKVVESKSGAPVAGAKVRLTNRNSNSEEMAYTNLDGTFYRCLPRDAIFNIAAEKKDYRTNSQVVSTFVQEDKLAETIELSLANGTLTPKLLAKGTVIILDKIFYDFDKSAIRSGAARDLDALALLMNRYPGMEIGLIAHTDSRGSKDYNYSLSLARAESAKDYLIAKGISKNRISAFGYGESKLRNHCDDQANCSEKEHQYNRRTEIRVLEMEEPIQVKYKEEKPQVIDYPDKNVKGRDF